MLYYQASTFGKIIMENNTDVFIIGGGINGAAIAADAAGRGLSVTLCEKNDLASGTSSASTKLIHGGLRYLEFYEFNLVRKALIEREILMRRAPNLIAPLEFILPYEKKMRPAWLIRLGLFIYDHLAKRNNIPGSRLVNFKNDQRGNALDSKITRGFSYYDCMTDDARLVVLNALSAKENGAVILPRTQFLSAERENNRWKIQLKSLHSNETTLYYAKALINVAGPWVKEVQKKINGSKIDFHIKLVKGSHIVIPKLYDGDFAYLLECPDNRVIFTIPYQNNFTLIGTTDIAFDANLDHPAITDEEKHYLCNTVNYYFKKSITPQDIAWSFAGVRCLQENNGEKENLSKITRDYKLLLESDISPPLLTVVGGKLTTHRALAEEALQTLKPFFPKMGPAWTANHPLPGWDFSEGDFATFYKKFKMDYAWLPPSLALRYATNYGTRARLLLNGINTTNDLGREFSAGLYQKEIDFLVNNEWAQTAEDILWRRTKLGLLFSEDNIKKLEAVDILSL